MQLRKFMILSICALEERGQTVGWVQREASTAPVPMPAYCELGRATSTGGGQGGVGSPAQAPQQAPSSPLTTAPWGSH